MFLRTTFIQWLEVLFSTSKMIPAWPSTIFSLSSAVVVEAGIYLNYSQMERIPRCLLFLKKNMFFLICKCEIYNYFQIKPKNNLRLIVLLANIVAC